MFRKARQIFVFAFLCYPWLIFSSVHLWPAFETIFGITGAFRTTFRVTGGPPKARTSFMKKIIKRIFINYKWLTCTSSCHYIHLVTLSFEMWKKGLQGSSNSGLKEASFFLFHKKLNWSLIIHGRFVSTSMGQWEIGYRLTFFAHVQARMEGKRLVTAFWLNDIIKRKKVRILFIFRCCGPCNFASVLFWPLRASCSLFIVLEKPFTVMLRW